MDINSNIIEFRSHVIDAPLEWLGDNTFWAASLTLAIALVVMTVWAIRDDTKAAAQHRHRMSKRAQPMSSYFLNKDRGEDFDFDFSQITLWVNEIDESKEYA